MSLLGLFRDPPPEFAFEIASDGIALSRTRPPAVVQHVPLAPGVLTPSPVRENILDSVAFAEAVRTLVPAGRGKRRAALILPDNAVRIAVLDFDRIPEKANEFRSLINFRLRKSVPFDIDEAALSYSTQNGRNVVVAFTPREIVAHYEAPFRAAGVEPGLVVVSSLAMMDLLPSNGSLLVARRSPGTLTLLALNNGVIEVARSIELTDNAPDPLEEISSGIYTTLTFVEDQGSARPEKLVVAGFGEESQTAATRLGVELEIPAEPLLEPHPGLAGYLASLTAKAATAKATMKKKAAA